ncbi:cyclin-Q-like [Argopecten irradians]|uniref:cyclin-Q-like n=1 Tax=Argopecten irradians TaxID=31199 RepID=UPI0037123DD5
MASVNTECRVNFRVIRFMYEAGLKLRLETVPLATAAVIYHKFFRENSLHDFDPYTIASTAIYLAGKVEEQPLKLRDVVNVCYRTLHKNKPPLEMGDKYWQLRDSIANCELFVLRMLNFKVVFDHPHRYLLHYLKFIKDWFEPYRWEDLPIARTAWALLRDCYHGNVILKYKPDHIAVAILYLTLQCHGVDVPYHYQSDTPWWKVFAEDATIGNLKDIMSNVMDIYDLETTIQ